jgi:hypothetical protein
MKLTVFVHLVDIPGSEQIARDILNRLIESKLINNARIFVYCQYNRHNFSWVDELLKDHKTAEIIYPNTKPEEFEIPTLIELKSLCDIADSYVLYLHHKGASRLNSKKSIGVSDWRELMLYHVVDRWEDCVAALSNGFDTVGVNWVTEMYPHYSGNFWWATSDYIKTLPVVALPDTVNKCSQFNFKKYPYRHDAEFWIGIGNPNACTLHNSNVDHYRTTYPPSLYKGNT